jgi:hypothetical protein
MKLLLAWMLDPNRDPAQRPVVHDVYLDTTALEPWLAKIVLAGHVVEPDATSETGLRIRDASSAPETHLNRDYMREMAAVSEDHALWDANITHGITYLADLPPQIGWRL